MFFTAPLLAQDGCAAFSPLVFVDHLDLNIFQGSSGSSVHLQYVTYVQLAFHDLSVSHQCVVARRRVCVCEVLSLTL